MNLLVLWAAKLYKKMMQITDFAAVFDACELFSSPACTINRQRMLVWKGTGPRIEPAPVLRGRVGNVFGCSWSLSGVDN